MSEETINPYAILELGVSGCLDAIIGVLPGSPTVEDLVDAVEVFVLATFYPSATPTQEIEIRAIIYASVNAYLNGGVNPSAYSENQITFIERLSVASLTNTTSDTVLSSIDDTENNIPIGGMNDDEQKPLFIATAVGVGVFRYFKTIIDSMPSGNPWDTYLVPAEVSALVNLSHWTSASMEGVLIGFKLSPRGMIEPTTDVVGVEIVSAFVGALVVVAGKIIFKWIPKVQDIWNLEFSIPNGGGSILRALPVDLPGRPKALPREGGFRALKVDAINTILGTAAEDNLLMFATNRKIYQLQLLGLYSVFGDTIAEGKLAAFISKARSTPYFINNIACVMGSGTHGFDLALTYNSVKPPKSQFNLFNKENEFWRPMQILFKITAVASIIYRIDINSISCSFDNTSGGATSVNAVAVGLATAIRTTISSVNVPVPAADIIEVNANSATVPFTYSIISANIDIAEVVRESFASWIASLIWLKQRLTPFQFTSAYIQNYSPGSVWGSAEADQMVQKILVGSDLVNVIDTVEATNYTTSSQVIPYDPPSESDVRDSILNLIADAAHNIGKVQNFRPIWSAEDINNSTSNFSGLYLRQNGMLATETLWKADYDADTNLINKNSLRFIGYSYYSSYFMTNLTSVPF